PMPPVTSMFIPDSSLLSVFPVHPLRRFLERGEGAGIRPPTLDHSVGERSLPGIKGVDVADFQFTAGGRGDGTNFVKYAGIIEINAGDAVFRFRAGRFLFDLADPVSDDDRDAEPARIVDLFQQHPGSPRLL